MLLMLFVLEAGMLGGGSSLMLSWFNIDAEALVMEEASSVVILKEPAKSISAPWRVSVSTSDLRFLKSYPYHKVPETLPM